MRMSRETKFGYGFLLVGWAVPYLLERIFGAKLALAIAVICTLSGVCLLIAGHLHRNEKSEQPWNLLRIGRVLSAVALLGAAGWTMWHFAQKRIPDEKAVVNRSSSVAKQQETEPPIKPPAKVVSKRTPAREKQAPVAPPAELQFSFHTIDPDKFPILETDAPLIDGAVTVEITALNKGTGPAKKGWLIITICNECRYAEEPHNMVPAPDMKIAKIVRERPFDEIYAGTIAVSMKLKIIPPAPPYDSNFLIGGSYVCEGCPSFDPKKLQMLKVNVIKWLPQKPE